MNKRITTAIVSLGLAGGALLGGASLANAQYGGDSPTTDATTTVPVDDTTDVQGLQVGDDTTTSPDVAPDAAPDGERPGCGPRHGNSEAVAEALGLSVEDVQAAREAGTSLADLATEQGVSVDDLVAAISADIEQHIAEEVANGEITQEEADAKLADLTERVTEQVNRTPGEHRDGARRGRPGDATATPADAADAADAGS